MPGPIAPFVARGLEAAGAAEAQAAPLGNNALDGQRLREVLLRIEASQGVVPQAGEVPFAIRPEVWDTIPADHQPLVAAAVARANSDPRARPARPELAAAAPEDVGKQVADAIAKLGDLLPILKELKDDITALARGAQGEAHWWGVRVTLTGPATTSLMRLLDRDINQALTALVPFVPKLAVVVAVTVPAGMALSKLIAAVRGNDASKGVVLELLYWVVPWVEPAA